MHKRHAATRKAANDQLRALRKMRDEGTQPTTHTVGTFADLWLRDVAPRHVRPTTLISMHKHMVRITRHIGHLSLASVTTVHAEQLLAALERDGLAPSTLQVTRKYLMQLFDVAESWGLISRNWTRRTKSFPVPTTERRVLTPAECARLIAAADAHGIGMAVRWGLMVGLRRGEALGVRWDDVDGQTGVLHISRQLQLLNGVYVLVPPKTTRSGGAIPLPPALVQAVRTHRAHQAAQRLRAGGTWTDHDLVTTTATGMPLPFSTTRAAFKAALNSAGLPDMRFHDLRHACGSLLAAQGVSVHIIKAVLRHAKIATTIDTYLHMQDDTQVRHALDALAITMEPTENERPRA